MSRRSSVSVPLTMASTCHSSPHPDDTFGDLFGTACETPGSIVTTFDDPFTMGVGPQKPDVGGVENLFDAMVDFDADPLKHAAEDFVNFDQHDFHDQDHFIIFSNEN